MTKETAHTPFRDRYSEEVMKKPDLLGLGEWYRQQLEKLGEMASQEAPLTDGQNWRKELSPDGEIEKVGGSHFTLEGRTITKHNPDGSVAFQWTQPATIQKETEINLPVGEKMEQLKLSGFVGAIKHEDRMLITLVQEPFANTPKKALARTPFQTSAAKLADILNDKRDVDPALFDLLSSLSPEKNLTEIFQMGILDIFPLPYADANRIDASNLGFAMHLEDPTLVEKLTNDGKNRWCTPEELTALAKTGLLNGHTAALALAAA